MSPDEGVSYVGYPIAELVNLEPEAVVYLLFHKTLPTDDALAAFNADLKSRRGLPRGVLNALNSLPREGHPMEWFISGLLYMGMTSKTGDYAEDALNLVARAPELVAAIFRIRSGWGDPIPSDPSLSLVDDFAHMLGVPGGDEERLREILRAFYILHMDHGGGNLSTFTGKAGRFRPRRSLCVLGWGHVLALRTVARSGQPRLPELRAQGGLVGSGGGRAPSFATPSQTRKRSTGSVMRSSAPKIRAPPSSTVWGKRVCADDPLFQTALTLREVAVKVLSGIEKISNPYPNVDAVSGTLLNAAGLTDSNYFTVLLRPQPGHGHYPLRSSTSVSTPVTERACPSTGPSSLR